MFDIYFWVTWILLIASIPAVLINLILGPDRLLGALTLIGCCVFWPFVFILLSADYAKFFFEKTRRKNA